MADPALTFALVLAALAAVAALGWLAIAPVRKRRRRAAIVAAPFPESWDRYLRAEYTLYAWLSETQRARLRSLVQIFVAEKRFEPCGDLDAVSDEMRVLIAAQACLLLLALPRHDFYPRLRSILLYPASFRDRGHRTFGLLEEEDDTGREIRSGESWTTGSVILAWDSVRRGARGADDGVNVVYHEFAHQLDQADGAGDGAPLLFRPGAHARWAEVMGEHYESLVEAANNPLADPLLDPYGAENPAEFFAVATETFYEMPWALKREHPDLYAELRSYYGVDPAEWGEEET